MTIEELITKGARELYESLGPNVSWDDLPEEKKFLLKTLILTANGNR